MTSERVSTIGQQVARYRKAAKMSAEDLAEKAGHGLTRSVIANLENGRKDDVTVMQLMALANALLVPPALLIADIFNPSDPSPYPMPGKGKVMGVLAEWIGGWRFLSEPDVYDSPAVDMAFQAWVAVRQYLHAFAQLDLTVRRYEAISGDDNPTLAAEVQRLEGEMEAGGRAVVLAISMMRAAGINVLDKLEEQVSTALSRAGITLTWGVDAHENDSNAF